MSFYVENIVDDCVAFFRIFFVSQSAVCGLQSAEEQILPGLESDVVTVNHQEKRAD